MGIWMLLWGIMAGLQGLPAIVHSALNAIIVTFPLNFVLFLIDADFPDL